MLSALDLDCPVAKQAASLLFPRFETVSLSKVIVLLLLLFGISAEPLWAQPGDLRPPEEIRRGLEGKLNYQNEYIQNHLDRADGYRKRGDVFALLSGGTTDETERALFAEFAIMDYTKAIGLAPDDYRTHLARAEIRTSNFLANFDDILADYLTAISLIEQAYPQDGNTNQPDDSPLPGLFNSISNLYSKRAEMLLRDPKLLGQLDLRFKDYSPWQDFDLAISYAQRSVLKPEQLLNLIGVVLLKGDAAYKAREFAIALASYQTDRQHLGEDYKLLCDSKLGQKWCQRHQRQITLTFSIRRARVLIRLKRPADALAEIDTYIAKAYERNCGEIFLLRAQASAQLGDDERALADEARGEKAVGLPCALDIQK